MAIAIRTFFSSTSSQNIDDRGIGKALMAYIENWAKQRGYRQIGLQVFPSNTPALNLYHQLGYQEQSLWMVKSLQLE